MRLALLIPALLATPSAFAQLDATPQTSLDPDLRCHLGVYALPAASSFITVTGTGGERRALQYTLSNGRFGTLREAADGTFSGDGFTARFEPCHAASAIQWTSPRGAKPESALRVRLIERETSFTGGDGVAQLHGKLVLPASGRATHAAVWIEGSNNDPSTDDAVWQYELARRGIAAFVYDKRATGRSGGAPTSDFHARALDTAAAVREAKRLAPGLRRAGVIGASQGGWVAPLTASKIRLDFVIAAYAMAEGPIAQDRELVEQQLQDAGFASEAALRDARELTSITARIVRSNMRDGFPALEAFKAKHANAPWMKAIQPRSYTGLFLMFSTAEIRTNGPALAQELTFGYEPRPVIESIPSRQLWLLGGSDRQAPNTATQAILKQIQTTRRDLAVVVFPKADHGLVEPPNRYAARQFDIAADWILRGKLPASGKFIAMPASQPVAAQSPP